MCVYCIQNPHSMVSDPMAVLKRGQEIFDDIIERRLIIAMRAADRAFEKSGATSTKTFVREFLIPAMKEQGLKLDTDV